MMLVSYLRDRATHLRVVADEQPDAERRVDLLDLAETCEDIANSIEERSTGG